MLDSRTARAAIVAAGVRLGARGLIVATEGNLSVRFGSTILITPSGRRKDELATDDVVEVGLRREDDPARDVAVRPSSDIAIHRAIYAARPDVLAIAHAHLAAAIALTLAGVAVPDPADLPETALFLPRLPFVRFDPPGSPELARAVSAALTDAGPNGDRTVANAVVLDRHGAIAVGADLVSAGDRLELVDLLCRVHREAVLLRGALRGNPGA